MSNVDDDYDVDICAVFGIYNYTFFIKQLFVRVMAIECCLRRYLAAFIQTATDLFTNV